MKIGVFPHRGALILDRPGIPMLVSEAKMQKMQKKAAKKTTEVINKISGQSKSESESESEESVGYSETQINAVVEKELDPDFGVDDDTELEISKLGLTLPPLPKWEKGAKLCLREKKLVVKMVEKK